ncbi:MAG: histidine ammonia-lyase [Ignavibacteria bacterium]
MLRQVLIDGNSLSLDDVVGVARGGAEVRLASSAVKRMNASRRWVERAVQDREVVYGVTTGFGALQNVTISPSKLRDLQRNLILSHCAGVGEPFAEDVVRAMMVLRANALAKGFSGIRVSTVETLLAMLNKRVHPVVPSQGSVGASGDLAPLSHMAAVMIGEGEAIYKGQRMTGAAALNAARIHRVALEAKEGIALNNGTQAMTALGVLALHDAERLADAADVAAAMSCEAVKGKGTPFRAEVHATRPHPGQVLSARNIRTMMQGSTLTDSVDDDTLEKVQDSYAIRCAAQVHGASRDALAYVRRVLETEINAATDNPLIFPEKNTAASAGNFHGQPIALAMDFLALAVAELGSISERRIAKLMDRHHNIGLPAFLSPAPGLHSGLMILQYTAAALVSENKVLIHPASGDSIPTSANQEDHVSMGTIAARQAVHVIQNVRRVLAIELICAAQALDFRSSAPGRGTRRAHTIVRQHVAPLDGDRNLSHDVERMAELVHAGTFSTLLPRSNPSSRRHHR